ncbi:hypothetical protein JCM9140_3944 [Halalkalibacter wakoensis JCM 9140]|uniref:Uncharacterized protein n=1 Tax=Halalkalibacter wakoensis JCM 9140 TaxID=1236970 RepID=W4Q744_9BACI|nr:hypothetical protein [Halalkalibacter wakoensis]GAE27785.1 hypothetical protein JCM9140_3944 [Halalkalibacter wakoensis JCM 9140]
MKKRFKLIVSTIVTLVILNLYLIYQTSQLSHEVWNLNEQISQTERHLDNFLHSIQHDLSELKQAEKWVTAIHFQPNVRRSIPGEIYLDVEWTLRDVEQDSNVIFMYKAEQSQDWIEVTEHDQSGTTYQNTIVVDPKNDYRYKIFAEGAINKGMEGEFIPSHLYQPTPLNLGYTTSHSNHEPASIEISLEQSEVVFDFYQIKQVDAIIHLDDGTEVAKSFINEPHPYFEQLNDEQLHDPILDLWYINIEEENATRIDVEVTYNDGTVRRENLALHW